MCPRIGIATLVDVYALAVPDGQLSPATSLASLVYVPILGEGTLPVFLALTATRMMAGRVLLMLPVIAGMTRYVTGVRVSWYG